MPTDRRRTAQDNLDLARKYEAIAPRYAYIARRALHNDTEPERLTIPQFRTLQTLSQIQGKGATNLDLARSISVSPPAMTAMVDGLVERGLVTRSTDPDNRRQVMILLTAAGIERMDETSTIILDRIASGIAQLSDQEVDALAAGLAALDKVFRSVDHPEEV